MNSTPSPRLASLGRVQFGLAMIGFGVTHLVRLDFVTRMMPSWPAGIPGRQTWAVLLGIALVAAGGLIARGGRGTPTAALSVGTILGLSLLLHWLPRLAARPGFGGAWTGPCKYLALLGGALFLAGLHSGQRVSSTPAFEPGARFARLVRILLGGFFVLGGVQHFVYASFVATLVPAWMPQRLFWTCFAGVALVAAGVGLAIPRSAPLAALLSGAMIFSWFLVVHLPRVAASPADGGEWSGLFESLALSGIAFAIAGALVSHASLYRLSDRGGLMSRRALSQSARRLPICAVVPWLLSGPAGAPLFAEVAPASCERDAGREAGVADCPAVELASALVRTADGIEIHYLHGGTAGALPAVVFIPGWTFSASIWVRPMASLAPTRRVVALDPRSQGDSSKTADGNTPEGRAGDVAAVLAELGSAPVVLVGWSQGVQDVAAYVERFGTDRLAGVVLVDAPFSSGSASVDLDPAATKQLLDRMAIYASYPEEYLAGLMDAIREEPIPAPELERLVASALKTPTSTGISMLVADVLTRDRRAIAAKLDKPTLVLASAAASDLEEQARMVAGMPRARLVVVQNAGHALFLDRPAEFAQELRRFLDELAAGPS